MIQIRLDQTLVSPLYSEIETAAANRSKFSNLSVQIYSKMHFMGVDPPPLSSSGGVAVIGWCLDRCGWLPALLALAITIIISLTIYSLQTLLLAKNEESESES